MPPQREVEVSSEAETVSVPDHELIQVIGRGSYGEVWLARNLMGVYRAVKVVYRKTFGHQRPFERELAGIRKFEPISRSHESFIDILHVGHNDKNGYFYYIMELGDDTKTSQTISPDFYVPKTLAKEVALRGRLPLEECVRLGLSLSSALDVLHKHGLVHRDVKPSNVIFVNGVPKLADIGLVADINEASSYVGTEGFIPPEGPGSAPADVYSLGKVLYEISTGKDRHDFPELPTQLDGTADLDRFVELNEVILHACKNDVGKRYQTAWDMHADLVVLANGKSVKRLKLLEKRLANLKRMASISAIVIVVLAAVLFQVYREWSFAREGRQRQIGAEVAYGTRAMQEGDLLKSLPSFAAALSLDRGNSDREKTHRLRLRAVLEQTPKLVQMRFGDKQVNEALFSPDGERILIIESFGEARVLDVTTGELIGNPFGPREGLAGGAWDPNGRWIATASYDGTACVWDPNTGERSLVLSHPDRVFSVAFSPDGSRIVTGCKDNIARIWKFGAGKEELELKRHTGPVLYATFSHDGRLVVTASRDSTAQIWNAADGKPIGPPLQHQGWVHSACFSPDDRKVVTASDDYKASVWEVESGRKILPDLNHGDAVMSAEFSPEGLMILTASLDGSARLWDAYSMQPIELNPVLRHVSRLMQASFAPDGHRIVAAGADGTAYTWDLAGSITIPMALSGVVSDDGTRLLLTNKNTFRILDTASMKSVEPAIQVDSPLLEARLSSNGRFALTVTANYEGPNLLGKLVRVWDCATGACVSSPIALTNRTARVSLSCDGQRLVVVTERGVRLWSTKDGKPVGPVKVHREPVSGAVLSSDGSRLAIFGGNLVSLWDTSSGHEVCAPLRHPLPVSVAEFSLAGHTIVTACKDNQLSQGEARVWDASTGKPIGHPMIHRDGILCAAFSRDGRRVITGGEDFTAVIWDVKTGNPTSAPMRQENQVRGVAFSPNGRWVATAALDGVARVWDAITGEPVTPPLKHPGVLQFVRYSADGYTLITANESGQIWRWDLRPDLRPSEDILLLSQLLSGAQSTASPGPGTLEERRGVWRSLRSAYPDDFAVSQEEVLGWHSRYARVSQTAQHWAAVVFHLSHLAALNPKDSTVLGRLKQSEDHLAEEKSR